MRHPLLSALAATTAFTLSLGAPVLAQEHHENGGHPAPRAQPAPPRAQPAPARPAYVPQGRPAGPPQGAPQFDRGRFGGGQPQPPSQPRFRVYEAPRGGTQAFGQAQVRPDHARPQFADPQSQGGQPAQGFARGQYERGSVRQGFVDPGNRRGFDGRQGGDRGGFNRGQGFVDNRQGGGDRGRFEGGHDRARDFERERHEYEHDHVDIRRFGGDADRYRHDYAFREWRGREYDPVRLQIINEYGYRPFGYGLGYGFNPGIGWGFDLRFGYWYGPRYYDPGYDFWYGPETFYREGVNPEELISRDSRLYNWALQWFDYDRDGYLERNELIDAARAFRRFADFDGNGYIDGREYNYALERIDGYQPERY